MSAVSACRICRSARVHLAGTVEYIRGYDWHVFDCDDCGCRFTRHDALVYDLLHRSGALMYYGEYRDLLAIARAHFDRGDRDALGNLLRQWAKYRFVMAEVDVAPRNARLLEYGCSRGYLASWFILDGRHVLGVDASADAVDSAREAFGDHFALPNSVFMRGGAPYDVIYHVGVIGCVADPVGLTEQLLGMLRPGGVLLFNAANRLALRSKKQLWFDSAPPPDLVTLFPPGFWRSRFANLADVVESVEECDEANSFRIGLKELLGWSWQAPVPRELAEHPRQLRVGLGILDRVSRLIERVATKVAVSTGLSSLAPRLPSEFGIFVKMTARQMSSE